MSGKKAFGEQNPIQGETPVSWQTWSNGSGSVPTIDGDSDWGKLKLDLSGEEGRSAVYDLGSEATRTFTLTENRYGTGQDDATLQIRTSTTSFNQDDESPSWATYSSPLSVNCRYVQIRETTLSIVTYYVDATNGDDDNDGLSSDQAWQTLTKVNASTFSAGDHVLFKRGETWSGQLTPTDSGTATQSIVFGAYGTGDRPKIDGSSARAMVISTGLYNYLRFESLHFYGSSGTNECVKADSDHLYFYDCEVSYSGGLGMTSWSTDGTYIYNNTWDSCIFHHNYRSGIYVGSTTAPGPHDCLLRYCQSYNNGNIDQLANGIYVKYGCIVEYCTTHDNSQGGLKTNCEASEATIYFPIVRYNISYGDKDGLYVACNGSIFHNNLVYNSTGYSLLFDGLSHDCLIYFNTLVNSDGGGGIAYGSFPEDQINNTIKNNIIIQDAAVVGHYLILATATSSLEDFADNNTWDYNIYYYNGSTTAHAVYDGSLGVGRDWADWVGFTSAPDANSIYLSNVPDFVTPYTNLHPANGGDLKGMGIAITGYDYDLDGNPRSNPPTPGCYEEASA